MTESEIVSKYNRNGRTAEQVQILAELNGTTKYQIIDILTKNGALKDNEEPEKKYSYTPRVAMSDSTRDRIISLRKDGTTIRQISETTGYSIAVVRRVLKNAGLTNAVKEGETPKEPIKHINEDKLDPELRDTVINRLLAKIDSRTIATEEEAEILKAARQLIAEVASEL